MDKYQKYLLPAVTLLTFAVFLPALWCGFVDFDDPAMVVNNPYILSGLTLDGIRWAFTTGYMANWIPLSWLSHMLDVQLFGMNPMAHHAVNILLHVINSAVLFLFLRRVTSAPWQSAFVALLFALHPLHVESVVWISERKDVLSGFFWVATLYTYSFYVEKPSVSKYLLVIGTFVLGLLSKPMLVTLPIVLLLLDWWPFCRTTRHNGTSAALRLLLVEKIPFLLLSLGSSFITYRAQAADGVNYQGYTFIARAARAGISYLTYLWMTFWPVDLAVIYPFDKYPPTSLKITVSILALLSLSAGAFLLRKRFPYLVIGWGWYLISLLPVIGLIQIGQHSVADRYTYLPLIGIFIVLAWGLGDAYGCKLINYKVLGGFAVAVIVSLAVLTEIQITYWKDTYSLFSHAVAVTKGNWVAHNNLGRSLLDQGKIDESIEHYTASIKAKPSYALAFLGIGVAYQKKGDYASSIRAFKSALMFEPGMLEARFGLGMVYHALGDKDQAYQEYEKLKEIGSPYAEELLLQMNVSSNTVVP